MFNKSKVKETWTRPKLFWQGSVYTDFSGHLKRIQIYGYYFHKSGFHIYLKGKQTDLRTSKTKTGLYWSRENISLIDQDKNFVIQSMIEKQKQQIKEKMESIQKDIDDIPNRLKRLQESKSRWQSLLTENKINEQTFSIKFERSPVNTDVYELKQRPIYIPNEIQNQSEFMTL